MNDNRSTALQSLGLSQLQAEIYLALLELASEAPPTGYGLAKHLGRDATRVYRALSDLERLGAVEVEGGRSRRYRPIPPPELVRHLTRDYHRRAREARHVLATLPSSAAGDEVFRLKGRDQLLERFRALLNRTERVALVEFDHRLLRSLRDVLRRALRRGVRLLLLGGAPAGRVLAGATVVEPAPALPALLPAPVLRGVFDARALVTGFLPPGRGRGYWTENPLLAYREHLGMAMEMAAAASLAAGEGEPAAARRRFREILALAHEPLDWEALWDRIDRPRRPRWRDLLPALRSETAADITADHRPRYAMTLAHPEPPAPDDVLGRLAERRRRWQQERDDHAESDHPGDPRHHPDR